MVVNVTRKNHEQPRKESSFSEEKEAKRLLFLGVRIAPRGASLP
jgi:hypothetical protein